MHQHRRLAILRWALNDDFPALRAPAAAHWFLGAQPVTSIVRPPPTTSSAIGTTVAVRPGDPPSPLFEHVADPHAGLHPSRQHPPHVGSRSRTGFPGRAPGQLMNFVNLHVHPRKLASHARGRASRSANSSSRPGPRHREDTRLPRQDSHPPCSPKLDVPGRDTSPATTHGTSGSTTRPVVEARPLGTARAVGEGLVVILLRRGADPGLRRVHGDVVLE
ncbi:hypothetical protein LV779_35230 [Streptomyces thinghirensis]|nr:hypothetical protein [Streptomyces thinghirensis]